MITLSQAPINFSLFKSPFLKSEANFVSKKSHFVSRICVCSHNPSGFRTRLKKFEDFILVEDWGDGVIKNNNKNRNKRVVLVRFNRGFGFNGGGGGGGNDGSTGRILGNLVLAIGLTYLSMTGQLGWVLDAIVSVWLLALILPVLGIGAFLWWAGRDMVQSSCPNCGNAFQVFKSTLNDELQLCPYCSQPFSVVDDEFVREPVKFSNRSATFGEAFNDFSSRSKKGLELGGLSLRSSFAEKSRGIGVGLQFNGWALLGVQHQTSFNKYGNLHVISISGQGKDTSINVVDVEAEVKDAD